MKFNYSYLLALVFAFATVSAQDNCKRNPYIGGPQNGIFKATEFINDLLQVRNLDTTALYIDTLTGIATDGSAFSDYIFTIDDAAAVKNWILIIRVSTFQNFTFVDDYIFTELANQPNASFDVVTAFNPAIDTTYWDDIANDNLDKNCNLIKESFTYFYEIFGDRFKKDLNN